MRPPSILFSLTFAASLCMSAAAATAAPDLGKLTATGGVIQVEGAGGGGLTPWALITGYGTRDSYGASVHATAIATQDYALDTRGVAIGIADRVEVSLATQDFRGDAAPLDRLRIRQDIVGIKLRVAGDAVYDQDRIMPQVAVGMMFKRHNRIAGLEVLGVTDVRQLGAHADHGIDYYVSATKILLAHSLLLNGTLRATGANQMGLLGYGAADRSRTRPQLEMSAAWLIDRTLVAGVEYRMKPRNLAVDREKDAYDVFVAWFPSKHFSITAAYVALGDITVFNPTRQRGAYLSLQAGF